MIWRFLAFAVTLTLVSKTSWAGIFTNGGGKTADLNNVWFLGPAPVEYCVDTSFKTDTEKENLRQLVRESLDDWKAFFNGYGLDQMRFTRIEGKEPLGLSLEFRELAQCHNPYKQLRILFGIKTSEITEILEHEPYAEAFASRGHYDYNTYRTGGVIFIANPYVDRVRLKHLIMHELGHIFGMAHNSLPIMIASPLDILIRKDYFQSFFAKIETGAWKYSYQDPQVIDFSVNDWSILSQAKNYYLGSFADELGFSYSGNHRLLLEMGKVEDSEREMTLSIIGMTQEKVVQLKGTFTTRSEPNGINGVQGPSLYTEWNCGNCSSRTVATKRFLDTRLSHKESEGFFMYNGQTYPAILEASPSLNLRIFIPRTGKWWSTNRYLATAFWLNTDLGKGQ